MGEMKSGLSKDENGEFIDASKVEAALKSVGVALRDSQGQFRDMDDVIMELGAKWQNLDSATKRYEWDTFDILTMISGKDKRRMSRLCISILIS